MLKGYILHSGQLSQEGVKGIRFGLEFLYMVNEDLGENGCSFKRDIITFAFLFSTIVHCPAVREYCVHSNADKPVHHLLYTKLTEGKRF